MAPQTLDVMRDKKEAESKTWTNFRRLDKTFILMYFFLCAVECVEIIVNLNILYSMYGQFYRHPAHYNFKL